MSLKFLSRPAIAVAASALGLVLSLPVEASPRAGSGARPAAAQPRAQHAHGVPRGNYERETVRTRTETGHTRNTTVTNGQGQTATRDISVARDPASGTLTRSMDSTGFGGQSRSADTVITRTGDGYTSNTQFTGPNGSSSRDVVVARDREAGTSTRDVAWSLPDGRTATSNAVTTRTADGFERSTTATGPNGNTGTRTVVVSRDPVTGAVTTHVTQNGGANPNGG